jgi:hypothetical protein
MFSILYLQLYSCSFFTIFLFLCLCIVLKRVLSSIGLFFNEENIRLALLLRVCLVWVLKFNKHCSTFVLFDKKFLILD